MHLNWKSTRSISRILNLTSGMQIKTARTSSGRTTLANLCGFVGNVLRSLRHALIGRLFSDRALFQPLHE